MNPKPIGVFDSGLGGLTVVKEIITLLPNENIIYLGDTARVPYGTRGEETIKRFSEDCIQFLLKKNVKCVVIACNTSSSVAGEYLKNKFSTIPVFDVISPVLKEFKTYKGKIGVIGTRATIGSGAYSKIKNITQISCPLLVPFIEEGEIKGELIEKLIQKYLGNLKVDTLILGCTHYPIISEIIQKQVGKRVKLINPGVFLAEDIKDYLTKNDLLNQDTNSMNREYLVTDLNDRFAKVAEMFLESNIRSKILEITLKI